MNAPSSRPAVHRPATASMNQARGLRAVLIVFSLLLAVTACAAAASIWEIWRSAGYREVTGTITAVGVSRVERNTVGKDRNRERTSSGRYLHVQYRYEVDGVAYEGNRLQAGTFGMTSGDSLKRFGAQFPEGKQVPVYVDPDDPRTAVLVRGWSSVATLLCVLCGAFAVVVMILRPLHRAMAQPPRGRLPG